jgi:hypothetical protein
MFSTAIIHMFDLLTENIPETLIRGRLTTSGRIECYYKAFGGFSILFIQVKACIGDARQRKNHVIAGICSSLLFFLS